MTTGTADSVCCPYGFRHRRSLINTVQIANCVFHNRPNQFLSAFFCIRTVLTAPKAADRRIMKTTLIWKMKFARKAAIITVTAKVPAAANISATECREKNMGNRAENAAE